MKQTNFLLDFGKWLLRLLIGAALFFGPLMLAVELMEPKLLLLYIISAAIMTVFLISYFKKR
jgi:membrane protein implicated in regulation of membrane protease activity